MADITLVKQARILVASKSLAAAGIERAVTDLRTVDGGIISFRVTNGPSGPTIGCSIILSVAYEDGPTPVAGAVGATWKQYAVYTCSTANNAEHHFGMEIPRGSQHLQIEFSGHTVQAVTVEAQASVIQKAVTV